MAANKTVYYIKVTIEYLIKKASMKKKVFMPSNHTTVNGVIKEISDISYLKKVLGTDNFKIKKVELIKKLTN